MLRDLPPISNTVARYFLVGSKTRNIPIQFVCSNVANQVALLLLPVLPHLLDDVPVPANPNTQNEMKTEVFMNPEKKLLIV